MTAEEKLFFLASGDSALHTYFGVNLPPGRPFRWCDRLLTQNYLPAKPGVIAPGGGTSSLVYRRVSTTSHNLHDGQQPLEQIRFQLDIYDLQPSTAAAAAAAVIDWFTRVNFVLPDQFLSVPVTPPWFANFQTNQRSGTEYRTSTIVYKETLDFMIWHNASN